MPLPANVGEGLSDRQAASEEIEAIYPQTGKLAEAATGVGGSQNQRTVGSVDGVGDLGDLLGVEEAHLGARSLGELDATARSAGNRSESSADENSPTTTK